MVDTVLPGTVRFDGEVVAGTGHVGAKRHIRTLTTADLTASATTEAVDIALDDDAVTFPANARLLSASIELGTVFAGGGAASVTAQVGDTGDPNELLTATTIFTGAALAQIYAPGVAVYGVLEAAAYAPECLVTSDVDVDTLTTGSMRVIIDYWLPDAL